MTKSSTLLRLSTLAIAIAAAYSTPVFSGNLNTNIAEGTTVSVTAGNPLWVQNDGNHVNKGSIVGDGELQFGNYGKRGCQKFRV